MPKLRNQGQFYRAPLLVMAIITLLGALWAGLLRLGWRWPTLQSSLPIRHGALMVSGFFGTLISLERAVAIGKRWAYTGPLMSGCGGLLLVFGFPDIAGAILLASGSLWLVIVFVSILRVNQKNYIIVMALGALALLVGNLLWLFGTPVYQFVFWWAAFLILTIAGERLELSRLMQPSQRSQRAFTLSLALHLIGLTTLLFRPDLGVRLAAAGILGLVIWLLRYDVARRTVKQGGITGFIAACILSGYLWLVLASVLAIASGAVPAGPVYDATLHAIFLGFVFAMVFGHGPIIIPALLGVDIEYKPLFYLPLLFLHASLLLRIIGDLAGLSWARLWGGLINALTILLYFAVLAASRESG
jgi:hypothetical protein